MSPDPQTANRATDEAAQWFVRLNAVTISTAELGEFRAWRRDPENDAAFAGVERLWRRGDAIHDDPEIQAALSGARNRSQSQRRLGPLSMAVGGGLVAVAAGVALVLVLGPSWSGGRVFQTAVGESRVVALEDGSSLHLDTDSFVRVRYTPHERLVLLERGQALFDVAHRVDRPFRVKVGDTVVQDIGTRFDVRKDDRQVRITVVEGEVQVGSTPARPAWRLTAGQQMTAGPSVTAPHAVDVSKSTSWTGGRLVFEDLPLSAATAEMNRYGRRKVVLAATGVGDIKVNGAFDSTDTQAFVAAVAHLYNLRADAQADGSIVLSNVPHGRSG